jgi:hypothetical protein
MSSCSKASQHGSVHFQPSKTFCAPGWGSSGSRLPHFHARESQSPPAGLCERSSHRCLHKHNRGHDRVRWLPAEGGAPQIKRSWASKSRTYPCMALIGVPA